MNSKPLSRLGMLGSMAALPTRVLASSEGGGDPVQLDKWQAGFTIAVFIVLLLILSRFAFRPILEALKRREEFIRDSIEQARKDRESAEARLKEYTEKVITARNEASAIVEEGRRDAEVVKRKIEESARVEAGAMVERAKREIGLAVESATKDLYTLTARLATDIASRLIKKEVDAERHRTLIDESIADLDKAMTGDGRSRPVH